MIVRRLSSSRAARHSAGVLFAALLSLCLASPAFAEASRIILLYSDKWEELFPLASAGGVSGENPGALNPIAPSAAQPLLLRTVDGKVAAARLTVEQLVAYWGTAAQKGYTGIGIDEFTDTNRRLAAKMVTALALTHWRYPRLYIAVWQSGQLSAELAEAYGKYANLVVLEAYASDRKALAKLTAGSLARARAAGILHKTVVGLGINNLDPVVGRSIRPWANTQAEIEAQMQWVHRKNPLSPGIALFAVNASPSLQSTAYSLAVKIFSQGRRHVMRMPPVDK